VSHVASHCEKGSGGQSGEIEFEFIDVAPSPIFAGLQGFDDRMFQSMKMFGRMFVFRRIATADVAAVHTQTEMHPLVTNF
jgi:hypothetical protein